MLATGLVATVGAVGPTTASVPVSLHGGTTVVGPHVPVLAVAVVGLWAVVAALVAAVDRLLAPDGE